MTSLVLRLAGPAQSWAGYRVNPNVVTTLPVPSKTGVAGLLGACLGVKDVSTLSSRFTLNVRADRVNAFTTDLQTASAHKPHEHPVVERAERVRTATTRARVKAQLTGTSMPGLYRRDFLAHSEFVVALSATPDDVAQWLDAVRTPVFMPYLGRRAHAPSFPFVLGVTDLDPCDLFTTLPRVRRHDEAAHAPRPARVRCYRIDGDVTTLPEPTAVTPPTVATREEYLTWCTQHLTR